MKKNPKLNKIFKWLLIGIVLSILGTVLYYLPYEQLFLKSPINTKIVQMNQLSITFTNGTGNIRIDGVDYGTTPQTINNLSEGVHKLEIEKVTQTDNNFYEPYVTYVEIHNGTETLTNIEIGPAGIVQGYTIYYTEAPRTDKGYLTIRSNNLDLIVTIDGNNISRENVNKMIAFPEGEHNINLSGNGYDEIEVPVIVRNGLNIIINATLMPKPINLQIEK
jgi:hypothetical protein